jgi:hypothetical protein
MRSETIPEQLQRAHDLIEEAISIIEDLREELLYKPAEWFDRLQRHALAALRDIRSEFGATQEDFDAITAADD